MGLAYVASACTGNEPCAINEDGGLVLGTVVAHEMGHVLFCKLNRMGCAHDKEGESTCPAQDTDESFFVMAPFVHLYTTRWSTCSRAFITALFENNLGECLNDEPETTLYQLRNALPGTIYDADAQCNMAFPHSTVCLVPDVKFCETLLCRTSPDQCLSKDEPPADGTKCGENKWCFRKDCVEIGERPEAVNGGWSAWGSWSACSRTCGGGVAMAERNCNNPVPEHKGLYCMGDRKKVKICNLNACPEGVPSFRETQCAEHNNKPIGGKLTKWRVYFLKDEPCVLYCLSEENIYSKLEPRVKDGTRCKPGTKDMCIAGVCKHIGCDGEIDSTAVEDICGVCNGDGTKCKIIDEVYTDVGARDYKKIATIPAGSRNIRVEELGPSINTIAISDKTESGFYLNPEHTEELDGNKRIGKTEAVYTHPEPGKELLIMHGPLDDDMILFVVFYKMENVGYQYRYAEMTADLSYTPHYQWQMLEWSECTVRCGGGFQSPLYTCVEDKAGKVSPNFCAGIEKVNEQPKSCNEQPCKTRWKVGKWSECHACKSKSGVKMREVECVREAPVSGKEDVLVEDVECLDPRPGSRQLCNSHKTCKVRRRKLDDDLPDDLMQEVWMQTNHKSISTRRRDLQDLDDADLDDEVCGTTTTTTTCGTIGTEESSSIEGETEVATEKIHLDVGKIIKDKIPSEEIKLIRVPLKQTHLSYNLSDNAFETMGDSVGDSIDTGKAEEVTGDEAAKILKELQQNHQKAKGDKRKRKKRFRYTDKCNG